MEMNRWTVLLLLLQSSKILSECKEVCHNEMFTAKCPEGHVVQMTSSLYGRMRPGKCVKTPFGYTYTDCYKDVLEHTHERCSGRPYCQIKVPDVTMDSSKPCNDDLISYLEANFTCIKVTKGKGSSCFVEVNDQYGHILLSEESTNSKTLQQPTMDNSNQQHSTTTSNCGLEHRPWILKTKPGQKVNLTLYDFTAYLSSTLSSKNDVAPNGFSAFNQLCSRFVVYRELNKSETIFPCRLLRHTPALRSYRRVMHFRLSDTNEVQLYSTPIQRQPPKFDPDFEATENQSPPAVMLIKYEAVGCPNVVERDPGEWMRRNGDRLTVGCTDSEALLETTCEGTTWKGVKEFNCSNVVTGSVRKAAERSSLPLGASIFVIVVMSVSVGLLVLVFGVCFMRRRKFCSVVDQAKDQGLVREMKLISSSDLLKRPNYNSMVEDACDITFDNRANSTIDSTIKSNLGQQQPVPSRQRNVQPSSCIRILSLKGPSAKITKLSKANAIAAADCCGDNERNCEALMHYEYVWQATSPEQQQQLLSSRVANGWSGNDRAVCCSTGDQEQRRQFAHHEQPHHHHHHHHQHHPRYQHQMEVPTVVFLQASPDSRPDLLRLSTSTTRTSTFYTSCDPASYRSLLPSSLQVDLPAKVDTGPPPQPCPNMLPCRDGKLIAICVDETAPTECVRMSIGQGRSRIQAVSSETSAEAEESSTSNQVENDEKLERQTDDNCFS